jgi:thiol-disulfide isomerase/thioredoxin
MRARVALVAVAVAAALLLTGCSSGDKLAAAYGNGTGTTNYTDDSGLPVLVKAADRTDPIDFTSTTDDGLPISAKDYRGKVVVVNFWYAGCAPCRAEAPILEGLYQAHQDKGVTFIGVNVTDQPDTALSFEKSYGITYPSVIDVDSGAARIAFHGQVSASAVPVTFVLDKKGRIAARIVGQLESKSILNTLITDTIAEKN